MRWTDVCTAHPDQWLIIEALDARTENRRRLFDRIALVEACADGASALRRHRELGREHPERELYFVHTENRALEIEERPCIGIRKNDAPASAR